jgi:tetratricopeptide (TPR) repeat protein
LGSSPVQKEIRLPETHDSSKSGSITAVSPPSAWGKFAVPLLLLTIVLLAILRSAVATRLDSFTIDENYHITAGVSYVRTGDYRINPEHPPLVKLWVGAFMTKDMFKLPPLQVFNDKRGERTYSGETVFLKNDPDRIQRRARLAMFCFNGILLFIFALVARIIFGNAIAIGALLFLAIDPTISAYMPVVMTDLPITLTSAIALLLAWLAFSTWKARYLFAAALALGLALATKHSGILIAEVITVFGLFMALRNIPVRQENPIPHPNRFRRLFALSAVLLGALVVLWGTYRFRYTESYTPQETFNRSLADKIADLQSPSHRLEITTLAKLHLFPRPYIWGLADIIRGGVEGRGFPLFFMGHLYNEHKPHYYFPVQILVKVPLGLSVIALIGLALFLVRKLHPELRSPFWLVFCFALYFLFTLAISNSQYAGVRHALPAYPPLALFAGAALFYAFQNRSLSMKAFLSVATLWALVSAIPALRPWEYYNELAGGAANSYRHFSDEGIDLGLRTKELAAYYHQRLEPKGELPVLERYLASQEEEKARGIHSLNEKWRSDELPDDSNKLNGTIIIDAILVNPSPFAGMEPLLNVEPSERFGSLLIFRGSFDLPDIRAFRLFFRGLNTLYSPTGGPAKASLLFQQAVDANPKLYPAWIELGNLHAQRGDRDAALRDFENALRYGSAVPSLRKSLSDQIQLLHSTPNPATLHPVRNPFME